MPHITVTDTAGAVRDIAWADGQSVMEAIRDAGMDDMLALCGGCCSCCTCQVWVDEDQYAEMSKPSQDESDLLTASDYIRPNSRLSCQIKMTPVLDGLRVTIAPAD